MPEPDGRSEETDRTPSGDRADKESMKAPPTEESPAPGDPDNAPPSYRLQPIESVADDSVSDANEVPRAASGPSGAVADLEDFKRTLIELGLISARELKAYEVDVSLGVLGLARSLVRAGRLTPYQSAAIYQKKSRGLLVGDYQILDKLGQGGMGVVFKVRHRHTGRLGALKYCLRRSRRDRTAVMRFKREVEAAGRIKHPNLVAAVDAAEDRGVHFLVMDYVRGTDLDHLIRSTGPLSVVAAVDYVIQAARGLEAAHAAGIVHRDIKPGNLMLDDAGTVRVLDLGLADCRGGQSHGAGRRSPSHGKRHLHGTVDYMAPEQAEDSRQADHRGYLQFGVHALLLAHGTPPVRRRYDLEAAHGPPALPGSQACVRPVPTYRRH